MIDIATNKSLKVDRGLTTALVRVSMDQLPAVRAVLDRHSIVHWTSESAISKNGGPYMIDVEFGRSVDPDTVQAILDAAE